MRHQEKDKKIILGIDPGSIVCGYGLIKAAPPNLDCSYIASGRIVLSSKQQLHVRLKELYISLKEIVEEYSPDEIAIEKVFFAKSIKSALTLGQARGAALIAAASVPVYEYSALEIKKAVVGYGRAEKHQVQGMVSKILELNFKVSKDSADALALALCHVNTLNHSFYELNRK